ncbi:MAG: hypothetical protein V3U79_00805 [Dehalococcoidia bacterium]
MDFSDAIAAVVQNVALPYGYTLSIWSAGVMAIYAYGTPRQRDALLFVAGAVIGFLVFDIPTYRSVADQPQINIPPPLHSPPERLSPACRGCQLSHDQEGGHQVDGLFP